MINEKGSFVTSKMVEIFTNAVATFFAKCDVLA
jgi:hypothetical protein